MRPGANGILLDGAIEETPPFRDTALLERNVREQDRGLGVMRRSPDGALQLRGRLRAQRGVAGACLPQGAEPGCAGGE